MLSAPADAAASAAESVAGNVVQKVAEAVAEAVGSTLTSMATLWVNVDTPGLAEGESAGRIQGHLWWFMSALAVAGVIVAGMKMAWEGRGEPLRDLLKSLLTLVLVSAGSLLFIKTAVDAGDAFSEYILGASLADGSFERDLGAMFIGLTTTTGGLSPMLIILVGVITILVSVVQIVMMFFRSAALVILAGVLPLSAAATNTAWGKQWFSKVLAWTIAFVLYKPAAAIIYASSINMFQDVDSLQSAIVGICMICIALFALPAMMRLLVPATAALAGAGAGGGGAALGAAGAMAASRGGGGGGGGPTGAVAAPPAAPWGGPTGAVTAGGPRGAGPTAASTKTGAGAAASGGGAAAGAGAAAGPAAAGAAVAQGAVSTTKGAANRGVGGE